MQILRSPFFIVLIIASSSLWACKNEDEPEVPLVVLPSEMEALTDIYTQLGMAAEDYPLRWNLNNPASWKGQGIELDTIVDPESGERCIVVSALTLYMTRVGDGLPESLKTLTHINDLKIYGCAGSDLDGRNIPNGVKKLLIDRMNPDDPGYIQGVVTSYRDKEVCLNFANFYDELTVHGVAMRAVGFNCWPDSKVDLSYNTLSGEVFHMFTTFMSRQANLSHNFFSSLDGGWSYWIGKYIPRESVPNLQYNEFIDIPDFVIESDFWKEYSDCFIGNPGYVAPQP